MLRSASILAAGLFFTSALTACGDPAGPGASGKVSLGTGVMTGSAQTLLVRGVPDKGTAFDPVKPVFDVAPPASEAAWMPYTSPVAGLTFPVDYEVGSGLGTTEQEKWRVFAWLSATTDDPTVVGPASGEAFGTATFSVVSCQQYGGFCQTTTGVNVVIDKTAP